ncbi:MAG: very short patch repair endonuclease [Pseudomonadota bacterium]|nr:very short patch repair endonuclease [Pseudomonadota bacterium]
MARAPRYHGLTPSSARASEAARGSSRKAGTKPELLLRRALWRKGFRYRKNRADLPGAPDIVFRAARVIVFVDGDFWHGKNWKTLKAKLSQEHNAEYWIRKIERNAARDWEQSRELSAGGWLVLRVWESDVHSNVGEVVRRVKSALEKQAYLWAPPVLQGRDLAD